MRAMNSESVDLIATDPPFNKGRDFHATPDSLAAGAKFQDRWSWERDVHEEWTDQITDDYPRLMEAIESARYAHSDGMGAYMCFMAVRLLEMRRVLKPTGSIYLHCDPTASHYLKACMDAIFGWRNFINEFVWTYTGGTDRGKGFQKKHDLVFIYSKGSEFTWNKVYVPFADATIRRFNRIDENGRRYKINKLADGRVTKTYMKEKGKLAPDYLHLNIIVKSHNEATGYPTQKPIALYKRFLEASSNPGDVVLDPFAGCATTLVAAETLDRLWGGIDIWEGAHRLVEQRLKDTAGLFGDVTFTDQPPTRTDEGGTASPFLRVKQKVKEPDGPRWTRAEMYSHLLDQSGPRCMGCDRVFDDPRYLELDHNTPRSDGGLNHISNRVLLCGPCNRLKSNTFTLSGLRKENKKRGFMCK